MRKPSVLALLAASVVSVVACTRAPAQMPAPNDGDARQLALLTAGHDDAVKRDLARVRAATAAFKDITAAQAVGYPTTQPQCIENPGVGGMGHHYVKRDLLDDKVDVEHPEILVYAPPTEGKPKLVGVEYIIPYRVWDREKEAPEIFGQKLKRSDELKIWYLHVWAWEKNENGLFADWNPAVHCFHAGAGQ